MDTHLESRIREVLQSAYHAAFSRDPSPDVLQIRPADRPEFGDYSTNLALLSASAVGEAPRQIAARLASAVEAQQDASSSCPVRTVEVAGPGFLNLFLKPSEIHHALRCICDRGSEYGSSNLGQGKRLQVEFVSSNPTGPLTVGHGRQAVLGDVLATLHARIGYRVHREYYFNDAGRQVDRLAESLWVRHRELHGQTHSLPEDGYQGEYLKTIARQVDRDEPQAAETYPVFDEAANKFYAKQAVDRICAIIQQDLAALGVSFDEWFSETRLHERGDVGAAVDALREAGVVYEEGGALWFAAQPHGGVKEFVLIRSDGRPTYELVDIAYHLDKHRRGFDAVLNVQGADHHAQQTCVSAAMRVLGLPEDWLAYAMHQFVSLKEQGKVLKMSTRAGRFVTLRDLIDDLGKDIVRYFMISRKPEAHLEFDLDLARTESADNPATYMQYAYTRIRSVFRKAGMPPSPPSDADLSRLQEPEELALIKTLDRFPQIIAHAALQTAPHAVAEYGLALSRSLHAYYDHHRVLCDDTPLQSARLTLLYAIQLVLRGCLEILGMETPEEM
jgi:arginyl-tRNA synthetase